MKVLSARYSSLHSLLFTLLLISSTFCINLAASVGVAVKPSDNHSQRQQQRQDYMLARQAFQRNDKALYEQLKMTLKDYPLYPYLEYNEIVKQLDKATPSQIDQFLNKHRDSYLADQLLKRWLQQLARQKNWGSYQRYYKPNLNSTALHCNYLWSKLTAGDGTIHEQIGELWNVGKSQPDPCDKVFNEWRQQGHLTPDIAWERHKKAIKKGNYGLARYISRSMPKAMRSSADVYRRINQHPHTIKNQSLFQLDTPLNRDIVIRGLQRYARIDTNAADTLWQKYQHQYTLSDKEKGQVISSIAIRLAREGHMDRANQLVVSYSGILSDADKANLVTTILRELLKLQRWRDLLTWTERLPTTEQQSDRWRYWRARALAETGSAKTQQTAKSIYRELSMNRSYYGFLAADQIESNYAFTHKPAVVNEQLIQDIQATPALQRSLELFTLGKMYAARHEWESGVKAFGAQQHIAAAKLATQWGWNRKAIESMTAAQYWDDLDIRFPLAHSQWINTISKKIKADDLLIYAIARQESAWAVDAHSSAGAIGLMQLMPGTAKRVASKIGLRYRKKHLFQPKYNITLGSRYIDSLIRRYNGNRPLALAAYNAGPARVKRWLTESSQQLPHDVWIEVIPFKETRKYVQNVLTYAVIYGYITGQSTALITQDEALAKL